MNNYSNTKIKSRIRKKTNPALAETISLAMKNTAWKKFAPLISTSSNNHSSINLSQIDKESKAGDTILVPGKILSQGNLTKKIALCALSISKSAEEKIKESKSTFHTIKEEIEKNKKFEGVKIIR